MKYAYAQVKIKRHYGEKDELKEFLDRANEQGWTIEAMVPDSGWAIVIYRYRDE